MIINMLTKYWLEYGSVKRLHAICFLEIYRSFGWLFEIWRWIFPVEIYKKNFALSYTFHDQENGSLGNIFGDDTFPNTEEISNWSVGMAILD